MAKAALPSLRDNASLLTLSYLGAMRYVPAYNTMGLAKASLEASVRYLAASLGPKGIRVNGISAGPIKTLAASGIKGFGKLLDIFSRNAPLRRNVTIEDVGNVAAFLLSGSGRRHDQRDHLRGRRLQPRHGAACRGRGLSGPPHAAQAPPRRGFFAGAGQSARSPRSSAWAARHLLLRTRPWTSAPKPGNWALKSRVKRR
jgi:hypothetical protein